MTYQVRIFYLDGKDVSIIMKNEDMPKFIECVKGDELFWDEKKEAGFFTPNQHVRYVQVYQYVNGEINESTETNIPANPTEVGIHTDDREVSTES